MFQKTESKIAEFYKIMIPIDLRHKFKRSAEVHRATLLREVETLKAMAETDPSEVNLEEWLKKAKRLITLVSYELQKSRKASQSNP